MYNNKNVVQKIKSSIWSRVALGAMLIGISMSSQASVLNLDLENPGPDLLSDLILVDYQANLTGPGTLNISGFMSQLFINGDANGSNGDYLDIIGGDFILTASISSTGELLSGGLLNISGLIVRSDLGIVYNSGSLLTGVLTDIGFADNTAADMGLQFLFNVTGGDAASLFGSFGGVIVDGANFPGSWSNNFGTNKSYSARADTGVPVRAIAVPEPTSMWLLGSSLLGLAGFARRKQTK